MAKTSWEKRVFTSIKIKKGNDKEVKEAVVETNPGDDESLDFYVDKAELEYEMEIAEEDSVKGKPVIAEILRGENEEDENIPEQHIEAYGTENDPVSAPIKATINGVKGKNKRKTIDDILGFTQVNSFNNKSRNNKPKCAIYRSAIATLALSASISSNGVIITSNGFTLYRPFG
ncbi:hypothetical protein RHMOL_Rhmol13G0139000 [Rhododendron molle]|uniref:Uncharacterized protein n=1 Tax=Rhododendron molle TaxID=49168 RepID=A0ACC0L6F6_RHOML|nr:hypothetical protein RHMOL_Rhmol13G0139000 [Rhododendron molle]